MRLISLLRLFIYILIGFNTLHFHEVYATSKVQSIDDLIKDVKAHLNLQQVGSLSCQNLQESECRSGLNKLLLLPDTYPALKLASLEISNYIHEKDTSLDGVLKLSPNLMADTLKKILDYSQKYDYTLIDGLYNQVALKHSIYLDCLNIRIEECVTGLNSLLAMPVLPEVPPAESMHMIGTEFSDSGFGEFGILYIPYSYSPQKFFSAFNEFKSYYNDLEESKKIINIATPELGNILCDDVYLPRNGITFYTKMCAQAAKNLIGLKTSANFKTNLTYISTGFRIEPGANGTIEAWFYPYDASFEEIQTFLNNQK